MKVCPQSSTGDNNLVLTLTNDDISPILDQISQTKALCCDFLRLPMIFHLFERSYSTVLENISAAWTYKGKRPSVIRGKHVAGLGRVWSLFESSQSITDFRKLCLLSGSAHKYSEEIECRSMNGLKSKIFQHNIELSLLSQISGTPCRGIMTSTNNVHTFGSHQFYCDIG